MTRGIKNRCRICRAMKKFVQKHEGAPMKETLRIWAALKGAF